ncbi:MAG: hypothetical protein WB505_01015, partial [Pseudolabrys sp.]
MTQSKHWASLSDGRNFSHPMRLSIDMRGKIRLSRWFLAATVLVVAECTGAASLKIALPAAHAQFS